MRSRLKSIKNINIVIIGFMGSGKSTVSDYMSRTMGRKLIDTDKVISAKLRKSISSIFEDFGEEYFRDVETEVVSEISSYKNSILSCGGGTILRKENIEYLKKNGIIVLLKVSPKTVLTRVKNSSSRPILNGNMNEEFIEELMLSRKKAYLDAADVIVSTDNKSIIDISNEIIDKVSIFANKNFKNGRK